MHLFLPFLSGIALFCLFPYFPFTAVLILVAASAALAFKRKFLLLPLILLGLGYALIRFTPEPAPAEVSGREFRLTGRFQPGREVSSSGNAMRTFRPDAVLDEESGEELEGLEDRDFTVFSDEAFEYDRDYELLLKTGKDRSRMNPGWNLPARPAGTLTASRSRGDASFSLRGRIEEYRESLSRYALENFSPDAAGLVISVTTGETAYMGDRIKKAFSSTGLAHILSISGTHFGLLSAMLFGVFTFLINRLPDRILLRLTMRLTPRETAAILTIPFMVFYLGLSGCGPPAVRSFIMISLFLFGLLLGRRGAWLNSLVFAAFILALWEPQVILGLSFQLSFLAVLVIGTVAEKGRLEKEDEKEEKEKEEKKSGGRALRYLGASVLITVVVTLGTAPLVAYHFHALSIIAPLANLVAAPLIGSLLVALAILSSISYLLTGIYMLKPLVGLVAEWSVLLVKHLSAIPHADIGVPAFPPVLCVLFYAGCIPYFLFGKKKALLVVPLVPFLIYAGLSLLDRDPVRVTFLDVGQGDSAVVQLPDGKTLVVDTGRTGKETGAFLKHQGIREIDALVLTHGHPDHTGGEEYIRENFSLLGTWRGSGADAYCNDRCLERGDMISAAGVEIAVLHPYPGFYTLDGDEFTSENNASVVLRIKGKKHSFLLAGDIETEAEENLEHLGKWLESDVIKIPHHGGRSSAYPAFLAGVSPSIAVISAGRENNFGHPSPEMLELLSGRQVLRTDRDDAIKITEKDDGLEVKTYRDFAFEPAVDIETELRNIRRLFETW